MKFRYRYTFYLASQSTISLDFMLTEQESIDKLKKFRDHEDVWITAHAINNIRTIRTASIEAIECTIVIVQL